MKAFSLLFVLPILFLTNITSAATDCTGLNQNLYVGNEKAYKKLVRRALTEPVDIRQVDVTEVLAEKEWLAIFASTEKSEPGVFFFKNTEFIDVWGGRIEQADKNILFNWAKKHYIPPMLTQCFYETVLLP